MAVFLHNRIRDAGAVTHLVDTHARESHWLDFKGGFWADEAKRPKDVEAAKDVAAFANAAGGDLVLGVG